MNGYQAKIIADVVIEADSILQGTGYSAGASLGDHLNMHLRKDDKYIHVNTDGHIDPWKAMFAMLAKGIREQLNDGS